MYALIHTRTYNTFHRKQRSFCYQCNALRSTAMFVTLALILLPRFPVCDHLPYNTYILSFFFFVDFSLSVAYICDGLHTFGVRVVDYLRESHFNWQAPFKYYNTHNQHI